MLKDAFKSFCRKFRTETKYFIINICGLSIGVAAFILITLYVKSELEYDQFHENSDRIYRVLYHSQSPTNEIVWARSGPGTGPVVAQDFPEVEAAVRIMTGKNVLDPDPLVSRGEIQFPEPGLFFADPDFFKVFTFKTLDGGPLDFSDPYAVVITASTAVKYFGDEDPIGQVLKISGRGDYKVVQVIEDVPVNSHFHFDLVANFMSHDIYDNKDWSWTRVYTYLMLDAKAALSNVQQKLQSSLDTEFSKKSFSGASYSQWKEAGNRVDLLMQPLESIHLNSDNASEFEPGGDVLYIRLFMLVALMVLLLACVNFVNLTTAQTSKRAKEVGVRKAVGASRRGLFSYFVWQSVFSSTLATLLGVMIAFWLFPFLNQLVGNRIAEPSIQAGWVLITIAFILILGVVSGAYPALYLSGLKPVKVLKPGRSGEKRRSGLRNALTTFQFGVSIGLVVGTLTIYDQVQFMQDKDKGFANRLMVLDRANVLGQNTEPFKQALLQSSRIESVSASSTVPGSWIGSVSLYPVSGTVADRLVIYPIFADFEFDDTFQFEFLEGRGFTKDLAADSLAVIINETAMKAFGFDQIEGQQLQGWRGKHPIVGVIKDFNQRPAGEAVDPIVIFANFFSSLQNMTIRFSGDDFGQAVEEVRSVWNKFAPSEPMIYSFLDDNFDRLYASEVETGRLFSALSLLALIIAVLGILGMAIYTGEQRGKEFAVRKVLGATSRGIVLLLGQRFTRLILLSLVLVSPLMWYLMEQWLSNFAYRTSFPLWSLIVAGLAVTLIALVAIANQALRVALENPVQRLRAE